MATSFSMPGGGGSGITLAPIRGSASSGFFAAFAQQLAQGVQYAIQRRSADQARKEQYALEFIKARMNPDAPDSMVRGVIALQALSAGKKNALDFYTDAETLAPDQFKQLSAQAAALKHFRQSPRESTERSETSPFQAEQETLRGIAGSTAEASPGSTGAPGPPGGGGMPGMPSIPIPGGSVPIPTDGGAAAASPAGGPPAAPGGGGGASPSAPGGVFQGSADASTNAANNLMSQIAERAGGARQQVEGGRQAEAQRLLRNVPMTPEEYRTSRMKLTENMDPAFQRFTQSDEAIMGDLQAGVERWTADVSRLAQEARAGTLDDARHFERMGIQYQGQVALSREGEAAATGRQRESMQHQEAMATRREAFDRELAGLRLDQQQQEDVRQAWQRYASTYTQIVGRQAPSGSWESRTGEGRKLTARDMQTINTAWVNEYMRPVFAPDTGAGMNALEATGYHAGGTESPNAAIRRAMTALKKAGYDDNQRLAAMRNMLSALALERSDVLVGGGPLMRLPSGL